MNQNSHDHSNQSKTDLSFSELLNSSIEYPKWMGKFYALMSAFYGSNWTDKFKNKDIAQLLIKSWYTALKSFSEETILESLVEYHHTHEFAPNSPSSLIEVMRNKARQAKQEQETRHLLESANQKRLEHQESQEELRQQSAHHRSAMAGLDKLRAMVGLPPFDEKKFKAGELVLDGKAHYYLNLMYQASGKKPKYVTERLNE